MRIKIRFEELLFDVRSRSHTMAATLSDPEVRYAIEAGSDKDELLKRCAITADARIRGIASRFVSGRVVQEADNNGDTPVYFLFEISASERRIGGKGKAIAQLIHSAMVYFILAEYYLIVMMTDLSKLCQEKGERDLSDMEALLYEKRPPEPLGVWRPDKTTD